MKYELKETLLLIEGLNVAYDGVQVLHDIHLEVKNIVRPDTGKPQG